MERRNGAVFINIRPENCTGCLNCQLRCSFKKYGSFCPSGSAVDIASRPGNETIMDISFKSHCDNCGLCASWCPYGALVLDHAKEG